MLAEPVSLPMQVCTSDIVATVSATVPSVMARTCPCRPASISCSVAWAISRSAGPAISTTPWPACASWVANAAKFAAPHCL